MLTECVNTSLSNLRLISYMLQPEETGIQWQIWPYFAILIKLPDQKWTHINVTDGHLLLPHTGISLLPLLSEIHNCQIMSRWD